MLINTVTPLALVPMTTVFNPASRCRGDGYPQPSFSRWRLSATLRKICDKLVL